MEGCRELRYRYRVAQVGIVTIRQASLFVDWNIYLEMGRARVGVGVRKHYSAASNELD